MSTPLPNGGEEGLPTDDLRPQNERVGETKIGEWVPSAVLIGERWQRGDPFPVDSAVSNRGSERPR